MTNEKMSPSTMSTDDSLSSSEGREGQNEEEQEGNDIDLAYERRTTSTTTTVAMSAGTGTSSRSLLLFTPDAIEEEEEDDDDDDDSDDDDDDDDDDSFEEEEDETDALVSGDEEWDEDYNDEERGGGCGSSSFRARMSFSSKAEMSLGDLSCLLDDDLDGSVHLSTHTAKSDRSETKRLVRKENKAVWWGRIFAVGSIIALGGLLAFTVYELGENDVSPQYAAFAVGAAFVVSLAIFLVYDCAVRIRHRKMIKRAHEARAIVSSLFPANVRDRLLQSNREEKKRKKNKKRRSKRRKKKGVAPGTESETSSAGGDDQALADGSPGDAAVHDQSDLGQNVINGEGQSFIESPSKRRGNVSHPKHQLKSFLNTTPLPISDPSDENEKLDLLGMDKPIADLFPNTSVLFADIVGFTAWSSEREPAQVFMLLQSLYQAFDRIAKRRGVFKVETIGDCYMAVTGLPDPQPDHAVRMTKFAREIMIKAEDVTKDLEVILGPDTGDLRLRVGINSGPVTAGVLQGEKSRFQLFGDTVNTASRMESTGQPDAVQVSASTAELLMKAGKSYWIKAREDLVHAKGKGKVQTYWVVSKGTQGLEVNRSEDSSWAGRGPACVKGRPGLTRGMSTRDHRMAPARTQSTFTRGEPIRGVQRTSSDNVANTVSVNNMSSLKESNDATERREERLVQWQVDLFSRLLKRIVVARAQKKASPAESTVIVDQSSHTEDESESHDVVVPLKPPRRLPSIQREPSFKTPITAPSRRKSIDRGFNNTLHSCATEISIDGVSILSQSIGELSFGQSFATENSASALEDHIVVDEVAEVIEMPKFDPEVNHAIDVNNIDDVKLSGAVVSQLKDYIATIAHMYRNNPFHNFEHASHVTMSANKLLNRIVTPESVNYDGDVTAVAEELFDYTYGITSDPLTQFAVVFSALVHDVDHTGVSNAQLAKENPDLSALYRNKSIAEQNSVDLAWDLFLDPMYKDLQDCIANDPDEQKRFRQLVVNSVMATDIFDHDMKELRNKRWDKAFHNGVSANEDQLTGLKRDTDRNIRATIVIEHIIQASDVAHTMQHWHIYVKWNERLFEEMMSAYECGRAEKNPADGWYKGELWFFDNYVIPLAKKLNECNVFGVSSDECLNYATANRNEWQMKGEEMVQQMVQRYNKKKFLVCGIARKPRKREPTRQVSTEA